MSELRMIPPRFEPAFDVVGGLQVDGSVGIGTSAVVGLSVSAAQPFDAPVWIARTTPGANVVLTAASPRYQVLVLTADRTCTLPPPALGMGYTIKHAGAAWTLTIKTAAAVDVAILAAGQSVTVVYDGTAWEVL